jgi:hypothetical protein
LGLLDKPHSKFRSRVIFKAAEKMILFSISHLFSNAK